ncbi:MAG: DUF5680 domain-containing protein [Nanoarchaeota archaeon]|mgnify:CR=1 FL=1
MSQRAKLGKLEIDLQELAEFIAEAKRNTYAGDGHEERVVDDSRILVYQKGDFHYTDNYDGHFQAGGNEIVRWQNQDGQRIWYMSYLGGMKGEFFIDDGLVEKVFDFLKKVLKQVTPQMPFRGPGYFIEDGLLYISRTDGDIRRFSGKEQIFQTSDSGTSLYLPELFSYDYIGGLFIPK